MTRLKAPAHLRAATARWWIAVQKDFDLEPHHVRLLTLAATAWDRAEAAREVIGRVHPDTEPALAMLKSEGFSYQGYVDIFDAGRAIEAETAKIRAIRDSQLLVLAIGTPGDDAPVYLVHNRKREDCRITAARARMAAGTLVVDPLTARRLRLSVGDQVRAVMLAAQA